MRLHDEFHAPRVEDFVNSLDVIDFVINHRRRMIDQRIVRNAKHDANAAAIKKGHVRRRLEQESHSQNISIKRDRAIEILYVNEDLADLRQSWANRNWC